MNSKPESTNKSTLKGRKWRAEHPDRYAEHNKRAAGMQKVKCRQKQFKTRSYFNPSLDNQIKQKHQKGRSIADLMIWFHMPESRIRKAIEAK